MKKIFVVILSLIALQSFGQRHRVHYNDDSTITILLDTTTYIQTDTVKCVIYVLTSDSTFKRKNGIAIRTITVNPFYGFWGFNYNTQDTIITFYDEMFVEITDDKILKISRIEWPKNQMEVRAL